MRRMREQVGLLTLIAIFPLACSPLNQETPRRMKPRQNQATATGWHAEGTHGAVSGGGAEAVEAGMLILKNGGNAADAAVATILALSVTDADRFSFGGEVPIMAYNAAQAVTEVIAGQGVAPRLATQEYFASKGSIPTKGIEVAAVPAVLDACLVTLERHGTQRFGEVALPTLVLLERNEQAWHSRLRTTLLELIDVESRNKDRSAGLKRVADHFYRGPIAHRIDAWSRAHGGLLRYEDLAAQGTRVEKPVETEFRGYTIQKCGPWTQGPSLLQALQILEPAEMLKHGPDEPETIHTIAETIKLALADRDQYYADPLFADVPLRQLLDPEYAAIRRTLIDPDHSSLELRPGDPQTRTAVVPVRPRIQTPAYKPSDTTTCLVADRWGNVVAATPSGWGGVLSRDTGIWLGSRLQSFRIDPNHPNAITPGKRPRITPSPTLVLKAGKPVLAVSVVGGDSSDQVSLQLVLDHLVFGRGATESVSAPHCSTPHCISSFAQAPPKLGSLTIEAGVGQRAVSELRRLGHLVEVIDGTLVGQSVLVFNPVSGVIEAAGDPRTGRHAAAY